MFKIYLLFLLIIFIYLAIEHSRLARSLEKIPLRILVNGTRGKSTLVKIIHQILRQSGQRVFAKTTGDQPMTHLPDGQMKTIPRYGPASIIENIGMLRRWARESPDSIVLECMALHPETQRILTTHIFKPNYILITNIYPDHAEAMGNRFEDMISTILQCTYEHAHILTTEQVAKNLPPNHNFSKKFAAVRPEPFPEKFDSIPHQIVDQNWSLIKSLALQLNTDSQIAYRCFREAYLSMNKKLHFTIPDLNLSFWDLFSVNDHESAARFIQHSRQHQSSEAQEIILLNTRGDRPLRTRYFLSLIVQEFPTAIIWLTGSGRRLAMNLFLRKNMNHKSITLMRPKQLLNTLKSGFGAPSIIYGVGNYYGMQEVVEKILEISSQKK
jgi:poly-gamma-glutamate synthase PgsB/CapB